MSRYCFRACFDAPVFLTWYMNSISYSGRYVGAEEAEDDAEPFAEKYPRLVAEAKQDGLFTGDFEDQDKGRQTADGLFNPALPLVHPGVDLRVLLAAGHAGPVVGADAGHSLVR